MTKNWSDCRYISYEDLIEDYSLWFCNYGNTMSYQERKDLLTRIRRKEILRQRKETEEFNSQFKLIHL